MPTMNVPSALAQPAEPGALHLLLSCVTVHVYSLNRPLCDATTGLEPVLKLVAPAAKFLQ